jgi:hypothetical protein
MLTETELHHEKMKTGPLHRSGFDLGSVCLEDSSVSNGAFELRGCYSSVRHKAKGFQVSCLLENTKFISITDIFIIIHCVPLQTDVNCIALSLLLENGGYTDVGLQ